MNLEMLGTTTQTESQNQGGIFSNPEGIENEFSGRIRMEEFYNHPKFSREEIDRDIAECERRKAHYDKINHANSDASFEKISRHIKGDSTAVHIGQALARLKSMPIGSFKDHRRTR